MHSRTFFPALLLLCVAPTTVLAGSDRQSALADTVTTDTSFIGVFADAAGTMPCLDVPRGESREFPVLAVLSGVGAAGFAGVEFRIEVSNPAGYQFLYNPPPEAVAVIGNPLDLTPQDPFDKTGTNIAFQGCRQPGPVPLGSISVVNLQGGPTQILVKRLSIPLNPAFNCALFNKCDSPVFTKVCFRQCAIDHNGEPITFRTTLNDSSCTGNESCPEACPGKPCVNITIPFRTIACRNRSSTFTATVTNCSAVPQDLDVLMNYE